MLLSFDDVLIKPRFSNINSRKDVSINQNFCDLELKIPVISSNMDTVTETKMAIAMFQYGGIGALHRFCSVDKNVEMFLEVLNNNCKCIVSLGISEEDSYHRVPRLYEAGARYFMIDVAHGAMQSVVDFYCNLRQSYNDIYIIVGNFADLTSTQQFLQRLENIKKPDYLKIGIGQGAACTTRIVTGCGMPALSSLLELKNIGIPLICDGGIKNSGDLAKALASGASLGMCGQLCAATEESPGQLINRDGELVKLYRGSASQQSYIVQGKVANHRAPEGEHMLLPYKGSIKSVLQNIEGGLRSALTYTGSSNIMEFQDNAELLQVSNNSLMESKAHGKKD